MVSGNHTISRHVVLGRTRSAQTEILQTTDSSCRGRYVQRNGDSLLRSRDVLDTDAWAAAGGSRRLANVPPSAFERDSRAADESGAYRACCTRTGSC
jgi:hypothetical protein